MKDNDASAAEKKSPGETKKNENYISRDETPKKPTSPSKSIEIKISPSETII